MAVGGQDITIFAGETLTITDTVTTKATGVVTDLTGATATFTLKRNGTTILTKTVGSGITVSAPTTGVMSIALTAANTTGLLGEYEYEVRVVLADTTVATVTTGSLTVSPTLTA